MQRKFNLSILWRLYKEFENYRTPLKILHIKDKTIHYTIDNEAQQTFKSQKYIPEDIQTIINQLEYLKEEAIGK